MPINLPLAVQDAIVAVLVFGSLIVLLVKRPKREPGSCSKCVSEPQPKRTPQGATQDRQTNVQKPSPLRKQHRHRFHRRPPAAGSRR